MMWCSLAASSRYFARTDLGSGRVEHPAQTWSQDPRLTPLTLVHEARR